MNFDYNEEQQLLADSVRRFLAKDYGFEARKKIIASKDGWSPQVWSTLAEMGLTGLPFSPDYGGFGGGAVDMMGVMEAAGDALLVEPYLPTLMGGFAVARVGSEAQKKALLGAVVEGKLKLAFAQSEKGSRYNLAKVGTQAKKAGAGWELTGEKVVVLGAAAADKIVVSAKTDKGLSLFLVSSSSSGLKIKPYITLDEQRAGDVVLSLPLVVFALGIVAACSTSEEGCLGGSLKPGLLLVIIIIALFSWPSPARLVRGATLSLREKEFVEAARALGAKERTIMFREILPNLIAPIVVYGSLLIPASVLFESYLSFLGLGVPGDTPSWGKMLAESIGIFRVAWWFWLFPGLFLMLTVLAFNLLGDGLRDALDPRTGR